MEPPVDVGVDDVHAAPRKTGHRALDMTLAICAITISVVSLFVAYQNARAKRDLVAASTWPFLVATSDVQEAASPNTTITLRIRNSGVGPARIISAIVRLDGTPVRGYDDFLARCCDMHFRSIDDAVAHGLVDENAITGVLQARDEIHVLAYRRRPGNDPHLAAFDRARARLTYDVCYCSVLDECRHATLRSSDEPRPVPNCTPSADDYHG
jgi:hypothetical protein